MRLWIRDQKVLLKMHQTNTVEECWAILKELCLTDPEGISQEINNLLHGSVVRQRKLWRKTNERSHKANYKKLR
jgi:hypothetical protein